MISPHLVLGGPGCGKTTRLLNIVAAELDAGILPSEIAFVSFTKAAAMEAATRAAAQFSLDPVKDLPWFRTIHSLAYHKLAMARDEVMGHADWLAFSDMVGEPVALRATDETFEPAIPGTSDQRGQAMLRLVDFSATTRMSLDAVHAALGEDVDWHQLKRFEATLAQYKADTGKSDFTDMLLTYAADGEPVAVRVAVIDEAQDLTRAQWDVIARAFDGVERLYIGGDDDQAIYKWAGADVATFLQLSATPEILAHSHRLPRAVHAFAHTLAYRIARRYPKPFTADARDGAVRYFSNPEHVDFASGSWLLLARNGYLLETYKTMCRSRGLNYATRHSHSVNARHVEMMMLWERLRSGKETDVSAKDARALLKVLDMPAQNFKELQRYTLADLAVPEGQRVLPWYDALAGIHRADREYYVSCLRAGEKLSRAPRIRIETIHGVKGAEADHVMLMSDVSARTARAYALDPDTEHRTFYVGATRAKESLNIITPQTGWSYPL